MDLFNNGVLVGEPITNFQARLLFLDSSYVSAGVEGELLTELQRKTLRNHCLVWAGLLAIFSLALYAGGFWYMTWIYARINQTLRIVMMERAEHLSLKYHSDSRTGDAMYRIYQDSATITNVFLVLVLSPTRAVLWLLFAIVVITGFNPLLGLVCLLTSIPIVYLFIFLPLPFVAGRVEQGEPIVTLHRVFKRSLPESRSLNPVVPKSKFWIASSPTQKTRWMPLFICGYV